MLNQYWQTGHFIYFRAYVQCPSTSHTHTHRRAQHRPPPCTTTTMSGSTANVSVYLPGLPHPLFTPPHRTVPGRPKSRPTKPSGRARRSAHGAPETSSARSDSFTLCRKKNSSPNSERAWILGRLPPPLPLPLPPHRARSRVATVDKRILKTAMQPRVVNTDQVGKRTTPMSSLPMYSLASGLLECTTASRQTSYATNTQDEAG
jgi:hypothetical protein